MKNQCEIIEIHIKRGEFDHSEKNVHIPKTSEKTRENGIQRESIRTDSE